MIEYTAYVDVSEELVGYVTGIVAQHWSAGWGRRISARSGTPEIAAKMALIHWRKPDRVCDLAKSFRVSRTTAYKYINEVRDALAACCPTLEEALKMAIDDGNTYVIVDGTPIPIMGTHIKEPDKKTDTYYSGKRHTHCVNVQVVSGQYGDPYWVGGVVPGSTHDMKALAGDGLPELLAAQEAGLPVLADAGYIGSGLCVPFRKVPGKELDVDKRAYNMLLRGQRAIGERANTVLKRWRVLSLVRCGTEKVGDLVKAILVLARFEMRNTNVRFA